MKVLHVIDALGVGGGAEHSLVAMLPEFRKRGLDNVVVCLDQRERGLFRDVQQMGLPYTVLPKGSLLAKARALRKLIKRERPEIVHATLVRSSLATRVACLGLGVSQINSLVNATYDSSRVRGGSMSGAKLQMLRFVDIVTARTVRGGFHALTEAVRREAIEEVHINPRMVWVVPRGRSKASLGQRTPERRERVRATMGVHESEIVVLHVGRQDWLKAQDILVRAFDSASASDPRLRLWIAGRPGNASDQLQGALDRAQNADRIEVLGHRTDVADLMCAADIFVLPSHHEGFGGVLLEAMALKCPIIASDAACFVEVLSNGRFGALTKRGDAEDLARAISQLASDSELRSAFANRAHHQFLSTYLLESVAERMVAHYRDVLSGGPDTP